MTFQGKELAGEFRFMLDDERIDVFTTFANVIEQDEYFITVARYQNFGELRISDVTLSRWEFEEAYSPIEPDVKKRTVQMKI